MTASARDGAPVVLTLGLTDPTGASGLQGDVLTLTSLGCVPLTVATAISIQDTASLVKIVPLAEGVVGDQLQLVLSDMRVTTAKVGHPGATADVPVIAGMLAGVPDLLLVLDATLPPAGDHGDDGLREAYRAGLVPRATVVVGDRAAITDLAAAGEGGDAVAALLAHGARSVLVTDTAEDEQRVNTLYRAQVEPASTAWTPLAGTFRGARDTLSAALAAMLANGLSLDDAVREAQEYTWQALAHATRAGRGRHLPDRFFWIRHLDKAEG